MPRRKGRQKEPDLQWLPAQQAYRAASLTSGLDPKSAHCGTTTRGSGRTPPMLIRGDAPDHGSSTGATRQAEIDQSFYGLEVRRMSDTFRLSDTAANHLAGARQ